LDLNALATDAADTEINRDRSDNVPIKRRLATSATSPTKFVSPLQSGCYTAGTLTNLHLS
jgi:hypothetical protein